MQLRLFITAHTKATIHRGCDATWCALKFIFQRSIIAADICTFVRTCIYFLWTLERRITLRPLGPAVHDTSKDDVLQINLIDLGPSDNGDTYVRMLWNDHLDQELFCIFPNMAA